MPKCDIPAEDNDSVNSSLLSLSSTNDNGSASNRSIASSGSLGLNNNNNNSPPLVIERSSHTYNLILDVPSICREPTLDAVLVIYLHFELSEFFNSTLYFLLSKKVTHLFEICLTIHISAKIMQWI